MRYVWAAASHVGLVRRSNEDSVFPPSGGKGPGPIVVAVADGMGGHAAGDVASSVAIEAATSADGDATVAGRVRAANDAVLAEVERDPRLAGMGTTLTLAIFDEHGSIHIGHVGDSRAYLLRDGHLRQLTDDHTLVAEMAALGQIRPDQVDKHPKRHFLTRALGMPGIGIDEVTMTVYPGDRLMLCSDGLTGMVASAEIAQILGSMQSPEPAAWSLVEAANEAGGHDNTTVIVVDVVA